MCIVGRGDKACILCDLVLESSEFLDVIPLGVNMHEPRHYELGVAPNGISKSVKLDLPIVFLTKGIRTLGVLRPKTKQY